ncbi:MAG: hypothetical protein ACKOUK_09790 [Verrucomicrobiota bacterium]
MLLVLAGQPLRAQMVLPAPMIEPLLPAALRAEDPSSRNSALRAGSVSHPGATRPPPPTTPFTYGRLALYPRVSASFSYSEGVLSEVGRPTNSYISSVSAGFRFDAGRNWALDYGTGWTVYSSRRFKNSPNHNLNFSGALPFRVWEGAFSQGYSYARAPRIETGRQTERQTVTTSGTLARALGTKWTVQTGLSQSLSFISASPDSYSWSSSNALFYRLGETASVGGTLGVSYVDVNPGVNMAAVTPSGSFAWAVSPRLTMSASAGTDYRWIFSRGVKSPTTPVFQVGGSYQLFDATSFSASASRSISPSSFRNQLLDGTSWSLGFGQRLLGVIQMSGSVSGQISGYKASRLGVEAGRKDDSYVYSLSAGTTVLRRISLSASFSATDNSSNRRGYGFNSRTYSVQGGFGF